MTKKELLAKLEALGPGIDDEMRNSIVCALIGHSRIEDICFGQVTCGRCGAIVGDTLAGCYDMKGHVVIDHNCDECKANYAKMGWQDKLFIDKEKVFPPPEKRRLQFCHPQNCTLSKKGAACEFEKKEAGVGPRVPIITWCKREGGAHAGGSRLMSDYELVCGLCFTAIHPLGAEEPTIAPLFLGHRLCQKCGSKIHKQDEWHWVSPKLLGGRDESK